MFCSMHQLLSAHLSLTCPSELPSRHLPFLPTPFPAQKIVSGQQYLEPQNLDYTHLSLFLSLPNPSKMPPPRPPGTRWLR